MKAENTVQRTRYGCGRTQNRHCAPHPGARPHWHAQGHAGGEDGPR
ncbi:hypothetical protein [Actinoplanes rectilineatus]|nr:hypothetical protein [Actinoplanes rectilineatus]